MWLVYWLIQLDRWRHGSWVIAFDLIITLLIAYLWVAFTAIRLSDLSLSRVWIVPLLIPLAIVTAATIVGRSKLVAGSGIIFVAGQLPILLMSSRKKPAKS
jgi:hypothetical protein